MSLILSLLGDAKGWLALLGGGLLAALLAYLKGRSAGRNAERAKADAETIKGLRAARETEHEVAGMDDDSVRSGIRPWLRKDD